MYNRQNHLEYQGRRKRFLWQKKITSHLKNGPDSVTNLKKALKVPRRQEKTFERGIRDLKDLEIVVEKEKRLHLHGHEEPEEVQFDIGSKNFRLIIPVKREIAKSIIRKSPSLKRQATAHKVLGEVGLLERSR